MPKARPRLASRYQIETPSAMPGVRFQVWNNRAISTIIAQMDIKRRRLESLQSGVGP
jgi:hypothetical protein